MAAPSVTRELKMRESIWNKCRAEIITTGVSLLALLIAGIYLAWNYWL